MPPLPCVIRPNVCECGAWQTFIGPVALVVAKNCRSPASACMSHACTPDNPNRICCSHTPHAPAVQAA